MDFNDQKESTVRNVNKDVRKDNVAQTTNETAAATTEVKTSVAGDKNTIKKKSEEDKLKEKFGELGNLQDFRELASLGTKDIGCNIDNRFNFQLKLEDESVFLAYLKKRRETEDMVSHGLGGSFLAVIANFFLLLMGQNLVKVGPTSINPDPYFKVALNNKKLQEFSRNGKIEFEKNGHTFELLGELGAKRAGYVPDIIIAKTVKVDGKTYNYEELRKELEEKYGKKESVRVLSSLCDFVAEMMTDDERVDDQKHYLKMAHSETISSLKREIFKTQIQAEATKLANQETPTIDPDIAAACAELSAKPGNFNRAKTVDTSLVDNISKVEQEEILDSFATAETSAKKAAEANHYMPESLFSYKEETKTDEQTLKN